MSKIFYCFVLFAVLGLLFANLPVVAPIIYDDTVLYLRKRSDGEGSVWSNVNYTLNQTASTGTGYSYGIYYKPTFYMYPELGSPYSMKGYNATLSVQNVGENVETLLIFNVTDVIAGDDSEVLIACNNTVPYSGGAIQLISLCNLSFPSTYTLAVGHTIKISIQNGSYLNNTDYPRIYYESGSAPKNSSVTFLGSPTPIPQVPEFPSWLIPVALILLAVSAYLYVNSRRKLKATFQLP